MAFAYDQAGIDRLLRTIDERMHASGKLAVETAQQLAPVRSGRLQASISSSYRASDRVLTIQADVPYAVAVEQGTATMQAQPYLMPALNAIGQFWQGGTGTLQVGPAGGSARPKPSTTRHRRRGSSPKKGLRRPNRSR
ncbi:HK97-gp10 family putative phage morphogenesis protein [Singulisphaera acidiphila]|uniref:Uncharacterized protein n=1 Tax=Singulisphaera acidiphila (strain ATCC BAA-1392 / DSM 18658 / VKM B-2454 / MOB10) TaxID=886293 RepID=L0DHS7_SINAD|nr:hypothetical protein [Singulisphaera acidiphila]AGA28390.1 Bacteriophage protein of unknown function (DUF646) [Singulisphaera acidiphila DSM 18658]